MNSLQKMSDADLLDRTVFVAAQERRIHAELIRYLQEIEARRLYLGIGYSSLYDFCTKHLRLSEGAASRRISCMRLIRDLKNQSNQEETLEALETGKINLSTLSAVHTFARQESKQTGRSLQTQDKQKLVREIQGRSQRECEVLFASLSPRSVPEERSRILTPELTEIRFVASQKLQSKLQRIRELTSHINSDPTYADLFLIMADQVLRKLDPESVKIPRKRSNASSSADLDLASGGTPVTNRNLNGMELQVTQIKPGGVHSQVGAYSPVGTPSSVAHQNSVPVTAAAVAGLQQKQNSRYLKSISGDLHGRPQSRAIPSNIRRQVWIRDQGSCTFIDPRSGRRCGSKFNIQLDHALPFGMEGTSTTDNLRCVCRTHNQWYAVQFYGRQKMSAYSRQTE